jgi:hypothetical protein
MVAAGPPVSRANPLIPVRLNYQSSQYHADHIYLARPSQISTVFYFGLEGLGGLEMETEEDDSVRRTTNRDSHCLIIVQGHRWTCQAQWQYPRPG